MIVVRSGGQTGSDLAGWKAAMVAGLPTAGWMPRGFLTEDGPRPEYANLYNAREARTTDYRERTTLNVRDSDATIIFRSARAKSHRGCDATKEACEKLRKPYIVIPVWAPPERIIGTADLAGKIRKAGFQTLNVAGSRGSSDPPIVGQPGSGIFAWTLCYCIDLFALLKEGGS